LSVAEAQACEQPTANPLNGGATLTDEAPKTTQRTDGSPDRPGGSEYTKEIGDMICEHLFEGESLRSICSLPGMPNLDTLRSWILHNPAFRQSYALTREFQAHCISDDTIDLADAASSDQVEQVRPGGRVVMRRDRNDLRRCRLRAEVRQWVATGLLACARQMSARTLFGHSLPRSSTL
jgi:hypothetical protein